MFRALYVLIRQHEDAFDAVFDQVVESILRTFVRVAFFFWHYVL